MSVLQQAVLFLCVGHIVGGANLRDGSLDGWHQRNPLPATALLSSVAHGNGTFLTLGLNGNVITSPDGTNWVTHNTVLTNTLLGSVAFGIGQFVVGTG